MIQDYKQKKTNPVEIYLEFFNGANSILEVNVPRSKCATLMDDMRKLGSNFDVKLFDDVEMCVYCNMSDNYSRFVTTREWKRVSRDMRRSQELLEGSLGGERKVVKK